MSDAPAERPPLCVIEPSAAERQRLADASDAFGCAVRALDPAELTAPTLASLADAAAIVVAWDLGGWAGLDLVEALAEPRARGVPLAMCAEAPTRGMVELALRTGARDFLAAPLDPATVRRRLLAEAPPCA